MSSAIGADSRLHFFSATLCTGFQDISVVPLRSRALVAFLQERGIPAQIAVANCQQIHYSCWGKRYYAVAFENQSGGYEIRNRYFKGCIAPKDISIRRVRDDPSTKYAVFEGFIDYISALTLEIINGADAVILNSVNNINKAIPVLKDYDTINCYIDNDNAGETALAELTKQICSTVIDCSTLYSGFNDLNEYLTHQCFTSKSNDYENRQSSINPNNSMTKDNSINPNTAVNSNESVDTINTTTSDNLFNNEQTTPNVPLPSKQQRIGKQQRKSDFADFKETYLMPSKLMKSHSVNIEESVWEQLERVARILGDRGSNVGSYINAILSEHLNLYASDIEV